MLVRAHEAHELQHHDQRPRGRLRQTEADRHLAGLEPSVRPDGRLVDVGEHGVRAAERDDRGLGEEPAHL